MGFRDGGESTSSEAVAAQEKTGFGWFRGCQDVIVLGPTGDVVLVLVTVPEYIKFIGTYRIISLAFFLLLHGLHEIGVKNYLFLEKWRFTSLF
jgi:hypothetical protein